MVGSLALRVNARQECVLLDELAPWFDDVAHQLGEDLVRLGKVAQLHLQQRAGLGSRVVSAS